MLNKKIKIILSLFVFVLFFVNVFAQDYFSTVFIGALEKSYLRNAKLIAIGNFNENALSPDIIVLNSINSLSFAKTESLPINLNLVYSGKKFKLYQYNNADYYLVDKHNTKYRLFNLGNCSNDILVQYNNLMKSNLKNKFYLNSRNIFFIKDQKINNWCMLIVDNLKPIIYFKIPINVSINASKLNYTKEYSNKNKNINNDKEIIEISKNQKNNKYELNKNSNVNNSLKYCPYIKFEKGSGFYDAFLSYRNYKFGLIYSNKNLDKLKNYLNNFYQTPKGQLRVINNKYNIKYYEYDHYPFTNISGIIINDLFKFNTYDAERVNFDKFSWNCLFKGHLNDNYYFVFNFTNNEIYFYDNNENVIYVLSPVIKFSLKKDSLNNTKKTLSLCKVFSDPKKIFDKILECKSATYGVIDPVKFDFDKFFNTRPITGNKKLIATSFGVIYLYVDKGIYIKKKKVYINGYVQRSDEKLPVNHTFLVDLTHDKLIIQHSNGTLELPNIGIENKYNIYDPDKINISSDLILEYGLDNIFYRKINLDNHEIGTYYSLNRLEVGKNYDDFIKKINNLSALALQGFDFDVLKKPLEFKINIDKCNQIFLQNNFVVCLNEGKNNYVLVGKKEIINNKFTGKIKGRILYQYNKYVKLNITNDFSKLYNKILFAKNSPLDSYSGPYVFLDITASKLYIVDVKDKHSVYKSSFVYVFDVDLSDKSEYVGSLTSFINDIVQVEEELQLEKELCTINNAYYLTGDSGSFDVENYIAKLKNPYKIYAKPVIVMKIPKIINYKGKKYVVNYISVGGCDKLDKKEYIIITDKNSIVSECLAKDELVKSTLSLCKTTYANFEQQNINLNENDKKNLCKSIGYDYLKNFNYNYLITQGNGKQEIKGLEGIGDIPNLEQWDYSKISYKNNEFDVYRLHHNYNVGEPFFYALIMKNTKLVTACVLPKNKDDAEFCKYIGPEKCAEFKKLKKQIAAEKLKKDEKNNNEIVISEDNFCPYGYIKVSVDLKDKELYNVLDRKIYKLSKDNVLFRAKNGKLLNYKLYRADASYIYQYKNIFCYNPNLKIVSTEKLEKLDNLTNSEKKLSSKNKNVFNKDLEKLIEKNYNFDSSWWYDLIYTSKKLKFVLPKNKLYFALYPKENKIVKYKDNLNGDFVIVQERNSDFGNFKFEIKDGKLILYSMCSIIDGSCAKIDSLGSFNGFLVYIPQENTYNKIIILQNDNGSLKTYEFAFDIVLDQPVELIRKDIAYIDLDKFNRNGFAYKFYLNGYLLESRKLDLYKLDTVYSNILQKYSYKYNLKDRLLYYNIKSRKIGIFKPIKTNIEKSLFWEYILKIISNSFSNEFNSSND